jgi:hypothetical protein
MKRLHIKTRVRLCADEAGIQAKYLLADYRGVEIIVVDFAPPPWETRMDRVSPGDYVPLSTLHQKTFNRRNGPLKPKIGNSPIQSL